MAMETKTKIATRCWGCCFGLLGMIGLPLSA